MVDTLTGQWLHFIESQYLVSGPALAMGLFLLFFAVTALFFQYLNLRRENRIFQMELGINTRIDEKNYELNERLLRLNEQIRNMAQEIDPSLSLFEQCRESMIMVCEERILDMNHTAMALFGFSTKEEWLDHKPMDLFPEKQACGNLSVDRYDKAVKKACESGCSDVTWRYLKADHTLFDGETIISTIQRCGRQVMLLSIRERGSDVRIIEETNVPHDNVPEKNDIKDNILQSLRQEIQNPLNGIIGMSELLKDTGLNEEQSRLLSSIDDEGRALLAMVNDILDFSKMSVGKLELKKIDFNFSIMMEDLAQNFAHQAQRKNLDFHFHLSPDIPIHLQGDPGKLRQILANLLGTALKFTDHGEIRLSVDRVAEQQGQVELLFTVNDTGIGFPPDKLSALFENDMDSQQSGIGLGPALAKQFVELMGGRVKSTSSQGKGSTFSFNAFFGSASPPASAPRSKKSLELLRIIVVGSTVENRQRVIRHLKYQGCLLDEASTEAETLSLLEWSQSCNKPYDIIIMEINMNDRDGFALTERIRSGAQTDHVPILAVTASGHQGDDLQCSEHGIEGYLPWPFSQEILIEAIEILAGQRVNDPDGKASKLVTRHSILEDYKSDFTILLAEDQPAIQTMFLNQLTLAGYPTVIAENGLHAVDLFKKQHVDLILMDMGMPLMDGLEAARTIRTIEREKNDSTAPRVPIVALTGNSVGQDTQRCLEAGMDDFFSKPVKQEALLALVDRLAMLKWKKDKGRGDEDLLQPPLPPQSAKAKPKILVVEDMVTNREIIIQHLTSAGYDVDVASNGLEGLELFKKQHYDLVLMDLQMPVMDGCTSAREMRSFHKEKKGNQPQTPIIAVTANTSVRDRNNCFAVGMDDFEKKPITRERLLEKVRFWLNGPQGRIRDDNPKEPDKQNRPIDYDTALSEFQNDKPLLDDVLKNFLIQVQQQIDVMSQALDTQKHDTLAKVAHAIKGGAANILAGDLSTAASRLEEIGKSGQLEAGPDALELLKKEFNRLTRYADERYHIRIGT